MMEAPPTAALIMPEANFLFEVFIIALDAPAHLGVNGCEDPRIDGGRGVRGLPVSGY